MEDADEIESYMKRYREPAIMCLKPYGHRRQPNNFSCLGGLPWLPDGVAWPRSQDGIPLHFLASINLAELPKGFPQLPIEGVLFFFALASYPFVGLSRTSSVRRMTDAAFINCEAFVEPAYELEQIPSVAALVEAGVGISALPELTLSMIRGANIVARPLSQPVIQRRIGSVILGTRTMPSHVAAFTEELRRTFRTVNLSR